jgi:hypothetical protein
MCNEKLGLTEPFTTSLNVPTSLYHPKVDIIDSYSKLPRKYTAEDNDSLNSSFSNNEYSIFCKSLL